MDLQTYLANAVAASRQEQFNKSDQLTLGEIILKVEAILAKGRENVPEVVYDFEYLFPTTIDSYRGYYSELALNFTTYDNQAKPLSALEFYMLLKGAVGKTYTGYKGGAFIMSKNTPVWVANYGNAGSTAVIDVIDNEYQVILITARRDS